MYKNLNVGVNKKKVPFFINLDKNTEHLLRFQLSFLKSNLTYVHFVFSAQKGSFEMNS